MSSQRLTFNLNDRVFPDSRGEFLSCSPEILPYFTSKRWHIPLAAGRRRNGNTSAQVRDWSDGNKIQTQLFGLLAQMCTRNAEKRPPLHQTVENLGAGSQTPAVGFFWREGRKKNCLEVFACSLCSHLLLQVALFSRLLFYANCFPEGRAHTCFSPLS